MRIESLPVSLPGQILVVMVLAFVLVGLGLLLLVAGDAIGAGAAPGADVRLAPFRWDPATGLA